MTERRADGGPQEPPETAPHVGEGRAERRADGGPQRPPETAPHAGEGRAERRADGGPQEPPETAPHVGEGRAEPGPAARRVAVRNPRGRATRPTAPGERALAELKEQTEVGEVLLRSLTRAQLMLAVRIFAVFGFFLLGLPALFATYPDLVDFRVLGLPLPWFVLGAAVYPLLVLLALLYVRQAERNERDFVEFIERS